MATLRKPTVKCGEAADEWIKKMWYLHTMEFIHP
jgi:hypothetical protein